MGNQVRQRHEMGAVRRGGGGGDGTGYDVTSRDRDTWKVELGLSRNQLWVTKRHGMGWGAGTG